MTAPADDAPLLLVVDDEPSNVDVLRDLLEALEYRTLGAGSGEAALALARDRAPDLVLLDVMMPGMDGLEGAAGSRRTPPRRPSPSCSSPPFPPRRTGPAPWTPAATTSSPSPSAAPSWWPASARCCGSRPPATSWRTATAACARWRRSRTTSPGWWCTTSRRPSPGFSEAWSWCWRAMPGPCRRSSAEGGVKFTVADDGPGIAEADYDVVFRKYGRRSTDVLDGPVAGDTAGVGSGLGLTFCKLAVEAHGGRVWVQSRPGEGAAFHFVLPRRPPQGG